MKRAYTQYCPPLKKVAQALGVPASNLSVDRMDEDLAEPLAKLIPSQSPYYSTIFMEGIDEPVIHGEGIHIFLPGKEFCDWLVSCVNTVDPKHSDHCAALLECFRENILVFNFPTESRLSSFAVNAWKGPDYASMELSPSWECLKQAGANTWLMRFEPDQPDIRRELEGMARIESLRGSNIDFAEWAAKLVIGLGMYCSCFPEAVKNGLPEDLKHPSHHQHKVIWTIGISPKISLGGTHASPTAHFRRGHFRVLRSEFYKGKRFQVVFVHETFVNGKAKTVLSPEQVAA